MNNWLEPKPLTEYNLMTIRHHAPATWRIYKLKHLTNDNIFTIPPIELSSEDESDLAKPVELKQFVRKGGHAYRQT